MKLKRITSILTIISIVSFSFFYTSCRKKDKTEEKDSEVSSASDQSLASGTVNDLTSMADEAGRSNTISSFKMEQSQGIMSACSVLTFDTLAAAKTITVSFGATNCLGNDGRYRRGAIVISFTGKYKDSLTVITVTPQNYFVNDNQVTGTKTITNKGHNSAHHLVYEINANIQIIKSSGSGTISWTSNRFREWTSGESTTVWNDDLYSITGSASGTTANGSAFTSVITSPLIRNMATGCRRYFTAGVVDHTPAGKATRTIDFGSGTCDDQATVTINGNVYAITLP